MVVHIAHSRNTHHHRDGKQSSCKAFPFTKSCYLCRKKICDAFCNNHKRKPPPQLTVTHTYTLADNENVKLMVALFFVCHFYLFLFCCRCIKYFVSTIHNQSNMRAPTKTHTHTGMIVEKFFPFVAGTDKMKIIINTEDNSSQKLCYAAIISTLSWCGDTFVPQTKIIKKYRKNSFFPFCWNWNVTP